MTKKLTKKEPQLKSIELKGHFSGYYMSNIREVLGEERFAKFKEWVHGETLGVHRGKEYVYKHDFDRFLRGLPPLD